MDQSRYARFAHEDCHLTGLYVRARHPEQAEHDRAGRWDSVDIYFLNKESLLEWLRSRGGDNPWAEDVVGILLGHGHLHEYKEDEEE